MVIDDDDDARKRVLTLLANAGIRAVGARDGAEAMQMLSESPDKPRLIFLDLLMPVMDAEAFRIAQAKDSRLAMIPTVVLTDVSDVELARRVGAPYMIKSVDEVFFCAFAQRCCSGQ